MAITPDDIDAPGLELADFEETQTFGGTPIGALVIASSVGSLALVIAVSFKAAPTTGFLIVGLVFVMDVFLLWGLRLRTVVTRDELRVGFRPFPLRRIRIDEITKAEAVTYRPLADAGGWGWKRSKTYGPVRSVWGNRAVAIEYGKDKRLLIGSQRDEELADTLRRVRSRATSRVRT